MEGEYLNEFIDILLGICNVSDASVYHLSGDIKHVRGATSLGKDVALCQQLNKTPFIGYKVFEDSDTTHDGYNFILGLKIVLQDQISTLYVLSTELVGLSITQKNALLKLIKRSQDDAKRSELNGLIDRYQKGLALLNEIGADPDKSIEIRLLEGLKLCTEYLDMEIGIISEINEDAYFVKYFYPEEATLEKNQEFDLGATYCDITVKAEKTIAIDQMSQSEYLRHPCYQLFNLESYIGTSYVANNTFGTINFSSTKPREKNFTSYEIEFIELISKWVIDNLNQLHANQRLEKEHDILRSFIESAPAAIAMFDTKIRYMVASKKWMKDYNITEDVIGISHYDIFPEIEESWKEIHERVLQGEIDRNDEAKFERKDGSIQYIKWEVRPWYTLENEIGGLIMFTEDVTSLVNQREEVLQAKIASDKAKIKEQFAYIASHDLQEPLRTINSLSEMLMTDYADKLDADGKAMITFINESGQRMARLIKGLLDYSRLGRDRSLDMIDLNELLMGVENDLRSSIEESKAKIIRKDLPSIMGYAVELQCVFQNLISNSIKFRNPDSPLEIAVEAEEKSDCWLFRVSDNGIGIDPKFKDKIFQIFQRLNKRQQYDGMGIGLAHCYRVAELHRGTIWVESALGKGATFYFTVAKNLEKMNNNDL